MTRPGTGTGTGSRGGAPVSAPSAPMGLPPAHAKGAVLGALVGPQHRALVHADLLGVEDGVAVDHDADLSLDLLPGRVVLENGLITDHGGVVPHHPGRHLELGALDVDQAEE